MKKSRYFDFLVYQESAPENWIEQLKNTHCMFAISPLHQPDEEGKKPHWHVIFYNGNGPITLEAAKEKIPNDIPANGYVEMTNSPSGYQRYLIHLDNPEKEQFDKGLNSIDVINGFPLDLTRELSKSEIRDIRTKLLNIIRDNGVNEYSDFIFGLMDLGDPDMLDYACNHTILFTGIINSYRNKSTK